jgi:hypothetical protein
LCFLASGELWKGNGKFLTKLQEFLADEKSNPAHQAQIAKCQAQVAKLLLVFLRSRGWELLNIFDQLLLGEKCYSNLKRQLAVSQKILLDKSEYLI